MVVNSSLILMVLALAVAGVILRRTYPARAISRGDFAALSLCVAVALGAWTTALVALIVKVAQ